MQIKRNTNKPCSYKLLKELVIYMYLINGKKLYIDRLNSVLPISIRSVERYVNELSNSGAIPKTRLKSDENGQFLEINGLIDTHKKFYKFDNSMHSNRLARLLALIYLKAISHPYSASKKLTKEFYYKYLNPNSSIRTFERDMNVLDLAYKYYKNSL